MLPLNLIALVFYFVSKGKKRKLDGAITLNIIAIVLCFLSGAVAIAFRNLGNPIGFILAVCTISLVQMFVHIKYLRKLYVRKSEQKSVNVRYCRKCGNSLLVGTNFCTECGAEYMEEAL